MNNLPDDIKRIIWEFDNTYHIKWKSCIRDIKKIKKMHIAYKRRSYYTHTLGVFNFSQFALKSYIDVNHSKLLFKWYYSDLIGGKYFYSSKI